MFFLRQALKVKTCNLFQTDLASSGFFFLRPHEEMFVCLFLFQYLKIIRLISAPLFIKAPSEKSTLQRNLLTPVRLPLLQNAVSCRAAARSHQLNRRSRTLPPLERQACRVTRPFAQLSVSCVTVYGLHARTQADAGTMLLRM